MSKVFCINCGWIKGCSKNNAGCSHPMNKKQTNDWYSTITTLGDCSKLNKDNCCEHFQQSIT